MWSKNKKRLDQLMCDNLKNRVDFHCVAYRMQDGIGRCYITVDKKEFFNMCDIKSKVYQLPRDVILDGNFSQILFFDLLHKYFDSSIEESMKSNEVITKILVLLDRRVGKRTLLNMKSRISEEPEIIQFFYKLRCDSEEMSIEKHSDISHY
jgi:hypothetical protein